MRRELRSVLSMAPARGLALAAVLSVAGCAGYDYPDTPPQKDEVFAAAREVLQERYPMSSASEGHAQLFALTPVDLEGNSRSRKQISIYVSRNWTGAYEPTVAVTQYIEWAEPPVQLSDPGSDLPARTSIHPSSRWRPLQRLPMEEKSIYDAIMGRLLPGSARTSPPGASTEI